VREVVATVDAEDMAKVAAYCASLEASISAAPKTG
jgi:hypothetical protein